MDVKRDFEATVVTGLEAIAAQECKEKLQTEQVSHVQGRIMFTTLRSVPEILDILRGVDNVYAVVHEVNLPQSPEDKETLKDVLNSLVKDCDWGSGLKVWLEAFGFSKSDVETMLTTSTDNVEVKPKFRVTCNRVGDGHCFTSMEAASLFGGLINDRFHWPVSMKEFDLEVMLNLRDNNWRVCLSLTKESLHRRHLVAFGPTTLRATICYNMLRLAEVAPGDIVCDPMCGSGAISVESALNWPSCFNMAADNHEKAMENTWANFQAVLDKAGPHQVLQLDVTRLPLREESVDVFVADLPFGKRMGTKRENRTLYPALLREMARCVRRDSGRAILLTQDKKAFTQSLDQYLVKPLWRKHRSVFVKVGGLCASIYCLKRTSIKI